MGKAGRAACILTPWLLTVASLVCLVLIEVSGWSKGGSDHHDGGHHWRKHASNDLGKLYFFQANFTNLTVASASDLDNTTTLSQALKIAKNSDALADVYQIHLWNYCSANDTNGTIDYCSGRHSEFYFDILDVWNLNTTDLNATSTSSADNAIESAIDNAKDNAEEFENDILGKSGKDAMEAYKKASKWMFIAYQVSFWTTVATLVCSVFAIFSRIGSFFTWLFSIVSSLVTLASVITSTVLFGVLVGALQNILHPYGIKVRLGTGALVVTWLAVVFSWAGTLFWLFSVCCCSGRSNPHHRSNRGGLWKAEPKTMGYGDYGPGMRVEKTGGGYERVASPYMGGGPAAQDEYGERVPLQSYGPSHSHQPSSGPFEPYRHA